MSLTRPMPAELRQLLLSAVDANMRQPLDRSNVVALTAVGLIADREARSILQAHLTELVISGLEHAIEERGSWDAESE